jgi:hypothetical protein
MNHCQKKLALTRFICSGAPCSGESGALTVPAGNLSDAWGHQGKQRESRQQFWPKRKICGNQL